MRPSAGVIALLACSLAGCEASLVADDVADPCTGLELAACRAEAGCVADTCLECSCTPVFVGCRAADAAPIGCPPLGCAQPMCCATQEACAGAGSCEIEPPPGCGACMPSPGDCADDRGCTGGQICEPIACSCEGGSHCVAGCEATGCDTGEVCDTTSHRCVEQPCTQARTECPPNFVCTWPEGGCLRMSCTSDANCPAGWCVLGLCEESLGTCFLPPP